MDEKQNLKQLPYGASDFITFQEKNRYYVDKTMYIPVIEDKGDFLLFIRPRRFGKSLFLTMMSYYYDIESAGMFDTLFSGTYIQQNPTREKSRYMVLRLDFSAVDPDLEKIQYSFFRNVRNEILTFLEKYKKFVPCDIGKLVADFETFPSASDVMSTFLSLLRGNKQKLYLIIDEYDNFANNILATAGEAEYTAITHGQGFLRAFFNVLKSGTTGMDSPISRMFIAGVSPITLDDVTSGFNIAANISLHYDLNEMMGFTRNEMEIMIDYYRQTGKIVHSTKELMELMSYWYNHYCFSQDTQEEVFNPIQVLNFLSQYMLKSKIPKILVDRNMTIDYQKLRYLIIIDQQNTLKTNGNFSTLKRILEDGSINATISEGFPIAAIIQEVNFTSLLYYFGLLTISGTDDAMKAILTIPNETCKRLYYDFIKETYTETGVFNLNITTYAGKMDEIAFKGNWEPLIEYITERMSEAMGLRDLITGEKSIQAFLNVYLGLTQLYTIYSEREVNKGFADLLMIPLLVQYPALKYAYLIEIKYIKSSERKSKSKKTKSAALKAEVEKLTREAVSQLQSYALDEKLQKAIGKVTLKKLVLVFCGHQIEHMSEV